MGRQAAGPLTGAPIGLAGEAVARIADGDGPLPVNNGIVGITPTAPRILDLPALSGMADGDSVTLRVFGAFAMTVSANGTDPINDVTGPVSFPVAGDSNATFVADKTTVPNTWITLT